MGLNKIVIGIGIASLVVGVISRVLVAPIPPIGLEAQALAKFASTCFLLSIALSLLQCKK